MQLIIRLLPPLMRSRVGGCLRVKKGCLLLMDIGTCKYSVALSITGTRDVQFHQAVTYVGELNLMGVLSRVGGVMKLTAEWGGGKIKGMCSALTLYTHIFA